MYKYIASKLSIYFQLICVYVCHSVRFLTQKKGDPKPQYLATW